jgi:hypothetical protein
VARGELLWGRPPFADDAIVVRGGLLDDDQHLWSHANVVVRETADVDPSGRGYWGVCIGCADGGTPNEIALRMPYGGDWMRVARLGDLRTQGFDVVPLWEAEADSTHSLLLLNEEPPTDAWDGWDGWNRLRTPFGDPVRIVRQSD